MGLCELFWGRASRLLMFRARIAKLFIKYKWGLIFCFGGNVWTSSMPSVIFGSKKQKELTFNSWWYLEMIFWPELILFYLRKWIFFFFLLFTFILKNATIRLGRQFSVSKTLWMWKTFYKDRQYIWLFHVFESIWINSKIFQNDDNSCKWVVTLCVNDTGNTPQNATHPLAVLLFMAILSVSE